MGIKTTAYTYWRKFRKSLKKKNVNPKNSPPYLISDESNVISGDNSFHNGNFQVKGGGSKVQIGSYCAIGENLTVILTNHNYNYPSIQYTFYWNNFKKLPYESINKDVSVEIGSDVWIGDNVMILPNVKIGNGACIGGGSIVTKDIPAYSVTAGVPAREIKKRFNSETIEVLEELKWWNMSKEEISEMKPFFFTDLNNIDSVKELLKKLKK